MVGSRVAAGRGLWVLLGGGGGDGWAHFIFLI